MAQAFDAARPHPLEGGQTPVIGCGLQCFQCFNAQLFMNMGGQDRANHRNALQHLLWVRSTPQAVQKA